jgi:hypothetical protein
MAITVFGAVSLQHRREDFRSKGSNALLNGNFLLLQDCSIEARKKWPSRDPCAEKRILVTPITSFLRESF